MGRIYGSKQGNSPKSVQTSPRTTGHVHQFQMLMMSKIQQYSIHVLDFIEYISRGEKKSEEKKYICEIK